MSKISLEQLEKIRSNQRVRRLLAFKDPLWFALLYLQQHFEYPFAPFHLEMFELIRQTEVDFIEVIAFRESGKSTVLNMVNVLWSILGRPEKKFAIVISQTQELAKNHFANIKYELEHNELLREDFGPFTENEGEWNKLSLELEYHGSKIMSLTRDQSVRGLKYNQHRPDLIICDDLEDTVSVKDKMQREALYERFQSEIIPLGNEKTRIVILGNLLLHVGLDDDQSFILRMRSEIYSDKITGIFRAYPLLDDNGKNLWPGRFPNREATMKLRAKMSKSTWILEYLLKSYGQNNDDGPNVLFEGIYYDETRKEYEKYGCTFLETGEVGMMNAQRPIVRQMKRYEIRVPSHTMAFFRTVDDPRYRKYLRSLCFFKDDKELEKRIVEDVERYK